MRISEKKKEKIFEQILSTLFAVSPKPMFTSHIATEIARDEEFTKKLLTELKLKKLIKEITKNSEGVDYLRRIRWTLSDLAYTAYKTHQTN